VSWNQIGPHARTIYVMAVHAELTSEGFYKEGSEYYPPQYAKDYGDGKSPSDFAADIITKHGDLMNAFNDFEQMPDPASFDDPIRQLETVCRSLTVDQYVDPETHEAFTGNGLRGEVRYLEKNLPSWSGRAAEKFNENYLSKLPDRASSQWWLAYTLLCSLRAEQELWKATQHDVDEVAHDTIKDLLEGSSGSGSGNAGAIATIFRTISALIPALHATVHIATATGTIIKTLDSLTPDGDEAVANNPADIISEMYERLDGIRRETRTKEQQICDDVSTLASRVEAHAAAFSLRRPALADGGFGSYVPH